MNRLTVLLCMCLVTFGYSLKNSQVQLKNVLLDYLKSLNGNKETALDSRHSAVTWLHKVNGRLLELENMQAEALWNFETNLTSANKKMVGDIDREASEIYQQLLDEAKAVDPSVLDQTHRRMMRFLQSYAKSRDPNIVEHTSTTRSDMVTIYNTGKVCRIEDPHKCLPLEPELENVMANSRDPAELLWAWKGWRDVTGPRIKPLYETFVTLLNEGAVEKNYADYGAYWREKLFDQTPDFEAMCDRLWLEVRPLYLQLHAYVRKMLTKMYGAKVVGTSGSIPAHLLGNMWAQEWGNIVDIVVPSSDQTEMKNMENHLQTVLKRKHDVMGLFRLAEEFFSSISLYNMTDTFWRKSMLVKPNDRKVQCHASAHDMFKKHDFRIKMCAEVTMDYLQTVHHEMGHVQYFMAYENQPTLFRDSPNSAFHEAVGDTMALSVLSFKHLDTLGLMGSQYKNSPKVDIMILLKSALNKIAFLPFGYIIDKWRWKVFSGEISKNEYNRRFWEMRLKYQGIVAPVPRSEHDFDPAAKFHIPDNSPYMSYFISFLAQFQFYESLCQTSGHVGPLHQCDFYRSQEAGTKFKKMLNLGKSVPWQQALFQLTGTRQISASSIKKYFEPLSQWLTKQLQGEPLGWDKATINWKD
ncbi:angiotensin-converting enzyme-like [Gigantopelta aegis]|uniref:angiotensin-converting enzyme-like n=1 Tax=Gigantopelta aegis TaxID=1735272 RepID=UPI001B888A98|nr:angiotensin-converting enzyme-like [Gigantopelta aegis]